MEPAKVKPKTKYTSTILKFNMKKKVLQNGAATSMSNNKITSMENMAEELKKARSVEFIG